MGRRSNKAHLGQEYISIANLKMFSCCWRREVLERPFEQDS